MNTKKKDINLKVIPTVYKGIEFRARVEARWAVVFDALGLDWVYEPEGYDDCKKYLTDFVIRNFWLYSPLGYKKRDLYIEVKGSDSIDIDDYIKFYEINRSKDIIVVGSLPKGDTWEELYRDFNKVLTQNWREEINLHKDYLKEHGIERIYCRQFMPVWNSELNGPCLIMSINGISLEDRRRTIAAYHSGLSARFEHGETPHILTAEDERKTEVRISFEKPKLTSEDILRQMSVMAREVDPAEIPWGSNFLIIGSDKIGYKS